MAMGTTIFSRARRRFFTRQLFLTVFGSGDTVSRLQPTTRAIRGISSVGRASGWQPEGQGFESPIFALPAAPEGASLFYKAMIHDLPAFKEPFILLLLGHMLCYMPTLALTASISFRNLENQEKQFPIVRVLGTIGWIAGNWAVLLLPGDDVSSWQFYLAGGSSVLLGLYCFSLPHTPPAEAGEKKSVAQILGLDSLRLFRSPSYAVFMLCSFLICIPLAGYYQQGRNFVEASGALIGGSATTTMSFGQMSEIFFMLVMPLFFVRLGVKNMLAIGMLAWVVRYGLFAAAPDSAASAAYAMVIVGILLHGICYDFFFVTGMIYVDKKASADIRNQAQGFLVLVTQGLGLGLGSKLFFALVESNTAGDVKDWHTIWLYPAIMAGGILVLFYALFWDRTSAKIDEADVAEAAALEEQP